MKKRPWSVTFIGWLLIVVGSVVLVAGLWPSAHTDASKYPPEPLYELALICLVRVIGIVGGVFMLRGRNWARWLVVAWIGFHVIIGFTRSIFSSVVHDSILAVAIYVLFRPRASAFFRGRNEPEKSPPPER